MAGIAGAFLSSALVAMAPTQSEQAAGEARSAAKGPATTGGPPGFRRLNEAQYKRSIEQIFGAGINVPGRFEPPLREAGLMSIGDAKVAVSASGLEQYELRAREISAQVLSEQKRTTFVPCVPQSARGFDQACASAFFAKYGRLLYRRPLSDKEIASVLGVASAAVEKSHNFYKGLEIGLSRLLASPKFIFRVEQSEPDASNPAIRRLDSYALATRISFLLWDAPPDAELLDAAASGELRDQKKLAKQIDRLIRSPRFEQGVRSFFADMLGYEQFAGLSKDQSIYPKFTPELAKDAQEEALRTIVDLLVTNKGDYRDLFTTKKTYINRNLGAVYKVPVVEAGMDGWAPYTFAPNDPRSGILTLAGFLMLDPNHEGRSSPTIRGKTLRELLLCQKVPVPPPNVDFKLVQDIHDPEHKTARDRLTVHQENPACAGCHSITDPIGLGMENYDAIGAFRTHENGALIDASGTFDGKPYKGLMGLSQLLHDSPDVPSCLVKRVYEYGVGRQATASEESWVEYASQKFAVDRYQVPALMRRIASSRAFQLVSPPQIASAN
jgi:hypothetical protein